MSKNKVAISPFFFAFSNRSAKDDATTERIVHSSRIACLLLITASTLALMGCDKSSPSPKDRRGGGMSSEESTASQSANPTVMFDKGIRFCGHTLQVLDERDAFVTSGGSVTIDLTKDMPGEGALGSVTALLFCKGTPISDREHADLSKGDWNKVAYDNKYGLFKYEKRSGFATEVAYQAPLKAYRKPDGSPFVVTCFSRLDSVPTRCIVEFNVSGDFRVSYTYMADFGLSHWKSIDQIVRKALEDKQ